MKYLKKYNEAILDGIPHSTVLDVHDVVYELSDLGLKVDVRALDKYWSIRKIGSDNWITSDPRNAEIVNRMVYEWIKVRISDAYDVPFRDLVEVIKRLESVVEGRRMNLSIIKNGDGNTFHGRRVSKIKTIHINHSTGEEFNFNKLTDVIVNDFSGNFDEMVIEIVKSKS